MRKGEAKTILLSLDLLMPVIKELNLGIDLKQLKEKIKIEDIKDTDLIKIKVEYPDSEMAVKINEMIANSFVSQGQAIYSERLSPINERLKELEIEIKDREERIKKIKKLIIKASSISDFPPERGLRIILLENLLSSYEGHLQTLKTQRNELKIFLSKAKDFKILESPVRPKYPIKPKKILNIAISAILGLMLGLFFSFFQEYWIKCKPSI